MANGLAKRRAHAHAEAMTVRRIAGFLTLGALALAVGLRRLNKRRAPAGGRRGEQGCGTAGVREPLRPLPTTLVGAGAAVPGE